VETPSRPASDVLRSAAFWLLAGAFFLASLATVAMTVHAIPFLLERGYGAGFAAFAVGLVGVSQIPGRVLFGVAAGRLAREWATALVFALIALGIAVVVSIDGTWAVVAGLVVLGMGNGMATLARATALADLYGPADYGTIAGVAGLTTKLARATGPVAAALFAAALGYGALLWTLAALSALAAALAHRSQALSSSGGTGR
jgi:predicted MFS family arabinose efflux permease